MDSFLPSNDCIYIKAMRFDAIIGIYDHEQAAPQPIVIDIAIGNNLINAAHTDNIQHTIDYDQLITLIENCLKNTRFSLLETLGEHICQQCFDAFRVDWIKIRLHKPNLFNHIEAVGIQLFRQHPDIR